MKQLATAESQDEEEFAVYLLGESIQNNQYENVYIANKPVKFKLNSSECSVMPLEITKFVEFINYTFPNKTFTST